MLINPAHFKGISAAAFKMNRLLAFVLTGAVSIVIIQVIYMHRSAFSCSSNDLMPGCKSLLPYRGFFPDEARMSQDRESHHNYKGLVIIGAAGRKETILTIIHNILTHFSGAEWDVLVNCYKHEAAEEIKALLEEHSETFANKQKNVTINLQEGFQFGDFFSRHQLLPTLESYQFISIVLDDVLLDTKYSVPEMIEFMQRNQLHVSSSIINGAGEKWGRMSYNEVYPLRRERLLAENSELRHNSSKGGRLVTTWEIFATFFTREAFELLKEITWERNHHFHGMDGCYYAYSAPKGMGRIGIKDDEHHAYHLENANVGNSSSALIPKAAKRMRIKWDEKNRYFEWLKQNRNVTSCVHESKTTGWIE
jgi:hypothetical protein